MVVERYGLRLGLYLELRLGTELELELGFALALALVFRVPGNRRFDPNS